MHPFSFSFFTMLMNLDSIYISSEKELNLINILFHCFSSTDFENPKVVDKIIRIFQGTVLTPGLMQHVWFETRSFSSLFFIYFECVILLDFCLKYVQLCNIRKDHKRIFWTFYLTAGFLMFQKTCPCKHELGPMPDTTAIVAQFLTCIIRFLNFCLYRLSRHHHQTSFDLGLYP